MRHGNRVKKLGRTREHRRALMKNLCRSLFIFEKIKTTLPKAKATRQVAERLIEFAKRNDLSAKRHIYRYIPDHKLVKIICEEIGPKFTERAGGYTRIYRIGPRLGDGAEMALLELVEQSDAAVISQRRKLIERRQLAETKKEKKPKEKKVKEKKSKTKPEEKKEEKNIKPRKSTKTKKTKKKSK
ncbi:MAG: 50S ribosomal protein L17 [candidate division WOR-3 bacterium]|nr:50S ribosomal protein L17 [candidate division WOR-3 bacterium]